MASDWGLGPQYQPLHSMVRLTQCLRKDGLDGGHLEGPGERDQGGCEGRFILPLLPLVRAHTAMAQLQAHPLIHTELTLSLVLMCPKKLRGWTKLPGKGNWM